MEGLGLKVSGRIVSEHCESPLNTVHRICFWAFYNEIPIYPIFYLLKGDYTPSILRRLQV